MDKCPQIIHFSTMKIICSQNDSLMNQYYSILIEKYVKGQNNMSWCPTDDCNTCIKVVGTNYQEIRCKCGTSFCIKCGKDNHSPASCNMAKQFI